MLNRTLFFLLLFIVCVSSTSFAQNSTINQEQRKEFHRHHIQFGPEFILYRQDKNIKNINSRGNRFFWGFRFRYEHLFPQSFYAGIDLASSINESDFRAYRENKRLKWHQASRDLGNFDLRLGYAFYSRNSCYFLTPFLGLGIYSLDPEDHHNDEGIKDSFAYLSGGIRFKKRLQERLELGTNLKILYVFREEARFKLPNEKKVSDCKDLWGGEVGIPLTWYITKNRRWNMEFEPYFLTLGFSKDQMIFGSRILFGFNF